MISKLGAVFIFATGAAILLSPDLHAVPLHVDATKIAYYTAKLKKLKAGTATYSTVRALVTRLAKWDPKKANEYYKAAISKLEPDLRVERASRLRNTLARILVLSDLPAEEINHVLQEIRKTEMKTVPADPTPTPYQADRERDSLKLVAA